MTTTPRHRFVFIRHAQAVCNRQEAHDRFDSVAPDSPLTPVGQRQARLLADHFPAGLTGARLYSSPMRRALQTASVLGTRLGLPLIQDDRLEEMRVSPPLNPSLTLPDWDALLQARIDNTAREAKPGVETVTSQQARVSDFLKQRHRFRGGEALTLIVSHALTIELAIMTLLGLEPAALQRWRLRISHTALHVVENETLGGPSRLVLTNAQNHLGLWL
ncbi:histidine phosphatase family protein [Sodalis endosymbiont of Spalangia cameroni]|uniref:histidine phosphatase family protein n=1 Tax=Sodalis praecaptivus TaxID=1239307 RepID=UPI0031F89544